MCDNISRQALIDAYGDWPVDEGTEVGFFGPLKELLYRFPSAERHGRWVDLHCSVCGKIGWMDEDNYCPNCGAKMDEVEE